MPPRFRQSYQLTRANPSQIFNLDFDPASLSIDNFSKFPVYVRIGSVALPGLLSFDAIIAPFSSYTGDPVGARSYCVVVDNSTDPFADFNYPVNVTFSTGAPSSQVPLSSITAPSVNYINRVKNIQTASLIDFWPLTDLAGTAAVDLISATRNGLYVGPPTLHNFLFKDLTNSVPTFVSAHLDEVNLFSAALASAFNAQEGTALIWIDMSVAHWADANPYGFLSFFTDANNYINIYKDNVNSLTFTYRANGTSSIVQTPYTNSVWVPFGISWSKSNNRVRAYISGTQQGADQAIASTYVGALTQAFAMAYQTGLLRQAPDNGGMIELWTKELTAAEIAAASSVN